MKYRSEIDGLRAVAVVSVVLYHAGIELFRGGFVGVDIFFVLSGYLITSILLGEIDRGEFSIASFYERRARRILPALFLVILCCLPFAWLWMVPDQLQSFGRSVVAVVFSVSNFVFWREESGYFTAAAELKPLLHTWSLGVEEQYYLVAPLALALLWRYGRRFVFWSTVAVALASLAATEWGWRFAPSANFYLPPFRIWELLAGAICGFLSFGRPVRANNALALAGLGLVLYSIFFFGPEIPFPSLYALVPVGGTALVVMYARRETLVGRLLSLSPFVGIGLISYSAYLWHQPLFAFARIRSMAELPQWVFLVLAVASFVLGYLSWRYVELPFRRKRARLLPDRRTLFAACSVAGLSLVGLGIYASVSHGIPSRVPTPPPGSNEEKWLASLGGANYADSCWIRMGEGVDSGRELLCEVFSPPNPKHRILVMGDSHSRALLPAFEMLGQENTIYWLGAGGCPPILGVTMRGTPLPAGVCEMVANRQYEAARSGRFDMVVLVARWADYASGRNRGGVDRFKMTLVGTADAARSPAEAFREDLTRTVRAYADLGLAVVLIGQVPEQPTLPNKIVQQIAFLHAGESLPEEKFERIIEESSHKVPNDLAIRAFSQSVLMGLAGKPVWYIGLDDLFRKDDKFIWGDRGGSYYFDGNHISAYGDRFVEKQLTADFQTIFAQMNPKD